MERSQLFDLMGELKLYGMKAAFDEIMATAVKRQHEPQRIIGDLLTAEVNEKQARSSRVQHLAASLRQRKELRRKPYHPIGMGLLYSYGDSCDEFPPRWHTATLQERSTTRSLRIARIVSRPTHVADAAISRPPAAVRVAADVGTVVLCGSSAGAPAAAGQVQVPCVASL
jgi:hypothetical protein